MLAHALVARLGCTANPGSAECVRDRNPRASSSRGGDVPPLCRGAAACRIGTERSCGGAGRACDHAARATSTPHCDV